MTSLACRALPWPCSTSTCPPQRPGGPRRTQGRPGLHIIPAVVSTTSQAQADIPRSYQPHANAYIVKPFDAARFADAIRHV